MQLGVWTAAQWEDVATDDGLMHCTLPLSRAGERRVWRWSPFPR